MRPGCTKILICQDGVRIETCANAANCSYKQQHQNPSRSKRSLSKNWQWIRCHHLSCLLPSYVLLWGPLPFPWGLRNSSKWAAWRQCKSQDMPCTCARPPSPCGRSFSVPAHPNMLANLWPSIKTLAPHTQTRPSPVRGTNQTVFDITGNVCSAAFENLPPV